MRHLPASYWPFPVPKPESFGGPFKGLERELQEALVIAYWTGVTHGVLAVLILLAVGVMCWYLRSHEATPAVRVTALAAILGAILWYAGAFHHPGTAGPATPAKPSPPKPSKPFKPFPFREGQT